MTTRSTFRRQTSMEASEGPSISRPSFAPPTTTTSKFRPRMSTNRNTTTTTVGAASSSYRQHQQQQMMMMQNKVPTSTTTTPTCPIGWVDTRTSSNGKSRSSGYGDNYHNNNDNGFNDSFNCPDDRSFVSDITSGSSIWGPIEYAYDDNNYNPRYDNQHNVPPPIAEAGEETSTRRSYGSPSSSYGHNSNINTTTATSNNTSPSSTNPPPRMSQTTTRPHAQTTNRQSATQPPSPPPSQRSTSSSYIEIQPGVNVPLRGTEETTFALECNFVIATNCMGCSLQVQCIADAEYVICPICKTISPIGGANSGNGGGVGLGMIQ